MSEVINKNNEVVLECSKDSCARFKPYKKIIKKGEYGFKPEETVNCERCNSPMIAHSYPKEQFVARNARFDLSNWVLGMLILMVTFILSVLLSNIMSAVLIMLLVSLAIALIAFIPIIVTRIFLELVNVYIKYYN